MWTSPDCFSLYRETLHEHVEPDSVMISTPLDKYEADVYELAKHQAKETGLVYSKKGDVSDR